MRYLYTKLLRNEEQLSFAISTSGLPGYVGVIGGANGWLGIEFIGNLTAGQKTTLDGIITAHTPDPNWQASRDRTQAVETFLNDPSLYARIVRSLAETIRVEVNLIRSSICPVVGQAVAVWDAPSIANGAGVTSPVLAVAGAAIGDLVEVSPPVNLAGLIVMGFVPAVNQVQVRLHNGTGAAVNLASGQWGVRVRRAGTMTDRSVDDLKNAVTANINLG